jgi:hypothetical protein
MGHGHRFAFCGSRSRPSKNAASFFFERFETDSDAAAVAAVVIVALVLLLFLLHWFKLLVSLYCHDCRLFTKYRESDIPSKVQ